MVDIAHNRALEKLVQKIIPHGRLLRAWPLKGGISAAMTALEVEQPGGGRKILVLRQPSARTLAKNPRAAESEYWVLRRARASGLAVPEAYFLDQSAEIFPRPYLVIEFIPGKPEFSPPDLPGFAAQMASHLAKIHRLDSASLVGASLSERKPEGAPDFPDLPSNYPLADQRIGEALRAAWPFGQRNSPALLHGDFWPGNILCQKDRLAAVIDWEDAALGDPLADLAISRLDILWIYGVDAIQSFTRAYQSLMPIDYADMPLWDLSAALRLARLVGDDLNGWAEFFLPFGRSDITAQTIQEHFRYFLTQALDTLL